jgi:hypothetical protein
MTDPTSFDELNARIKQNARIEGTDLDARTVLPCAFCGAADWMVFPVTAGLTGYDEVQKPTKCQACGRVARFIMTRLPDGSVDSEFVQVEGRDPPDWLDPKPRRI